MSYSTTLPRSPHNETTLCPASAAYAALLAALSGGAATGRLGRWMESIGLDPALLATADIQVADMAAAQTAYRAVGLDTARAQALGLPGAAELQGQGRSPHGKGPFQLFGKGKHSVWVCPYHDPLGNVVDLVTLAPPTRRRGPLRFGLRGPYNARTARVPYGLWDRDRIQQADAVILTQGELAQLHLAQMGYAALGLRPGRDWSSLYLEFLRSKTIRLALPNDDEGRRLTRWLLPQLARHGTVEILDPAWYGTAPDVARRSAELYQDGLPQVILDECWRDPATWHLRCQTICPARPTLNPRGRRGPTSRQLRQLTRLAAAKVWLAARDLWEQAGLDRRGTGTLALSVSQLMARTGLSRPAVIAGLAQARQHGLLKSRPVSQGRTTVYTGVTPLPRGLAASMLLALDDLALIKAALVVAQRGMAASIAALARLTGQGWRLARRAWTWLQQGGLAQLVNESQSADASTDKRIAQTESEARNQPLDRRLRPKTGPSTCWDPPGRPPSTERLARAFMQNESLESLESLDPPTADSKRERRCSLLLEIGVYPDVADKILASHPWARVQRHLESVQAFRPKALYAWFLASLHGDWPLPDLDLVRRCRALGVAPGMVQALLAAYPERVRQQLDWLPQRTGIRDAAAYLVDAVYADRPPPAPREATPRPSAPRPPLPAAAAAPAPAPPRGEGELVPPPLDPVRQVLCDVRPDLAPLWRVSRAQVATTGTQAVLSIIVPHEEGWTLLRQSAGRNIRSLEQDGWAQLRTALAPAAAALELEVTVDPPRPVPWDWSVLVADIATMGTYWDGRLSATLGDRLSHSRARWDADRRVLHLAVPEDLDDPDWRALRWSLAQRHGAGFVQDVVVDVDDRLRDAEAELAELTALLTAAQAEVGRDAVDAARLVRHYAAQHGLDYVWEKWEWVCRQKGVRNPLGLWRRACADDWGERERE